MRFLMMVMARAPDVVIGRNLACSPSRWRAIARATLMGSNRSSRGATVQAGLQELDCQLRCSLFIRTTNRRRYRASRLAVTAVVAVRIQ
jgi:hypothetical protein